jgi:hypothetical protein
VHTLCTRVLGYAKVYDVEEDGEFITSNGKSKRNTCLACASASSYPLLWNRIGLTEAVCIAELNKSIKVSQWEEHSISRCALHSGRQSCGVIPVGGLGCEIEALGVRRCTLSLTRHPAYV